MSAVPAPFSVERDEALSREEAERLLRRLWRLGRPYHRRTALAATSASRMLSATVKSGTRAGSW